MDNETLQRRRAQRARQRRRRRRRRRALGAGVAGAIVLGVLALTGVFGGSGGHRVTRSPPRPTAATLARSGAASGNGGARRPDVAQLGPATGRPGHASAPILMYHVVNQPPPGAPYPALYVPASQFAAQMRALKRAGYVAITLGQLRANWREGSRLPPGKPIVITFDNGYRSQYTTALPILRRLHWAAVENLQLTGLPPSQGGLTDRQIRALIRAGWELDTQGLDHADLTTLDAAQLHAQINGVRHTLQRRFHVPVRWFCYPSGQYDPTVIAAVRSAGFVGSTTVVAGWAARSSDRYELPRLRVVGGTSPSGLLAQIAGARGAPAAPPTYETN